MIIEAMARGNEHKLLFAAHACGWSSRSGASHSRAGNRPERLCQLLLRARFATAATIMMETKNIVVGACLNIVLMCMSQIQVDKHSWAKSVL